MLSLDSGGLPIDQLGDRRSQRAQGKWFLQEGVTGIDDAAGLDLRARDPGHGDHLQRRIAFAQASV